MKDADNLSAKRAAATEANGEIEEVDGGDDEDSSDLIFVSQIEQNTTAPSNPSSRLSEL